MEASAEPGRVAAAIGAARLGRVPRAVLVAIAGAWALAIIVQASGTAGGLHHDALIEGQLPFGFALALFLLAWQAMIAAMMLPSSLPLVRLFAATASNQPRPGTAMGAFLGGYALVWSVFGALAFGGDLGLHRAVHSSPWLEAHPGLIAGSVLILAGAFQFTELKDRCLRKCRHPGLYLLRHYRRGAGGALRLGAGHGLFCVGCCWALMLVMFAVGVANLLFMAALTALMVHEKTAPSGDSSVPVTGIVFLAWGGMVLILPWLLGSVGAG